MTQKELLYVDDAINHEKILIDILNNINIKLTDNKIQKFIEKEIKTHTSYKEKLINFLKEQSNE